MAIFRDPLRPRSANLLLQFSLLSLVAFVVLGVLVVGTIGPVLEAYIIDQQKEETVVFGNRLATELLVAEDFQFPIPEGREQAFQTVLSRLQIQAPVVILFLDATGTVIYGEPPDYIGQVFLRNPDVARVLQKREAVARFVDLSAEEKEALGVREAFLQVAPFTFGRSPEVVGALYTFSRTGLIRRSIEKAEEGILWRIVPGFGLLYALLVLIVALASRIINRQRSALEAYATSLEEKVKDRTEELERLHKQELTRTDQFFNIVAHELRTPIVPARLQMQLLMSGRLGELNEKQTESLDVIYRNEERLRRLISDILDVARSRAKALRLFPEKMSLKKVIEDEVKEKQPQAVRKAIEITASIADLPEIVADPSRLAQVLVNLLDNAIKFTEENGTIKIEALREGQHIIVRVRDDGIGIEAGDIKKLFTPFYQVEKTAARTHEGTGLGLVVSKGIVEAHGGKLWAESEGDGKGSTFTFTLPVDTGLKPGEQVKKGGAVVARNT